METNNKPNPQYSNPHAEGETSNEKKESRQGKGPFHEHPSEDPQVQERNEGKLSVDDDPEKAKEKLLEDKAGAYLLEETSEDEKNPKEDLPD